MKALVKTTLGEPAKWLEVQQIAGEYSISGQGVVVSEPAHGDTARTTWLAPWYAVESLGTATFARTQAVLQRRNDRREAR